VTAVSQLKISDSSGEKVTDFEVLYFCMSVTTTQLLSSGEFWKLRYDTMPIESLFFCVLGDMELYIAHLRQKCHNSKLVIFQEKVEKF